MANPALPPGDETTILDGATLWRRISPEWWVLDTATGTYRLSSAAFQNARNTNTMSVGLADEMEGASTFLYGHDGYGIAAFGAGYARQTCNQSVARAPELEQPWHAHVIGNKSGGVKKALRDGSTIVVEPRR